jgi:O-antigen/teichoic acid export membrane protein
VVDADGLAAREGIAYGGIAHNLLGTLLPAVVGLLAIPLLVAGLGAAHFGILTLAWTIVAYSGVAQLGLGTAVVHAAAGRVPSAALARTLWSALLLAAASGLVAGSLLLLLARPLADLLRVPAELHGETVLTFRILAAAVPFAVISQPAMGMLAARGRFGRLNLVVGVGSSLSYLVPALVVVLGGGLAVVALALAIIRAAAWLAHMSACFEAYPELRSFPSADPARMRALVGYGGWVMVSGIVSPLMTQMDRFFVAALISAAAVAHYAAPQEVILRLGVVSGAVFGVLLPAFSARRATGGAVDDLLARGARATALLVLPFTLVLAAFAGEGLSLWLGTAWPESSRWALTILAFGLLINGFAKVAGSLLLGAGRARAVAAVHLLELVVYLPVLVLLVRAFGIVGAAAAWTLRAAVDAALLMALCRRHAAVAPSIGILAAGVTAAALGTIGVALALESPWLRAVWVAAVLGALSLRIGAPLLRPAPLPRRP